MGKSGTASDASTFCNFIERFRLPEEFRIITNSFKGLTVIFDFYSIFLDISKSFSVSVDKGGGSKCIN